MFFNNHYLSLVRKNMKGKCFCVVVFMPLLHCTLKFRNLCVLLCFFCELLFKCSRTLQYHLLAELFWIFFSNYFIKVEVAFCLHILLNALVWKIKSENFNILVVFPTAWLFSSVACCFASHFYPHHSWHSLWATIRAEWSWTKPLIKESASSWDDRDGVGERTDLINKAC